MTKGRRKSYWLASLVTTAVVLWFGSGLPALTPSKEDGVTNVAPAPKLPPSAIVEIQQLDAESVTEEVRLHGQTAPNRQVTIRAETAGRAEALLVERGARVHTGQAVARLAVDDRLARKRKAAALLTQRERDFDAIRKLADTGHLAGTRVDEAFANLEAARAELLRIDVDIAKTTLRAPFDGILNERDIELGDFVVVRDPVFTIVDDTPLIVSASVAQRDRGEIAVGDQSEVSLITGEELAGTVRYISAIGNEDTRTFRIEIEIPNADGRLPTGVSAEAIVPVSNTQAHRLSPGWLIRTDNDEFGVYLVDKEMQARFAPVEIVRATTKSIWVTGLPASASVVSSGQGFLSEGQIVHLSNDEPLAQRLSIASGLAASLSKIAEPGK